MEPDAPAITESLRGALSLELIVSRAEDDLHSGNFGGAIAEPAAGAVRDRRRAPGRARPDRDPGVLRSRARLFRPHERAEMAAAGPSDRDILADAGTTWSWGEPGYTAYERTTIRPALTVTAIRGGHQGRGVKAIVPARASAMLDFRLAADQDPAEIDRLCRASSPASSAPSVDAYRCGRCSARRRCRRRAPALRCSAARAAYRAAFGRAPTFLRIGGTIPVVHLLERGLRVPTVMMGFALPDSNLHAPDENLHLPTFFRGIRTSLHFLREMAGEVRHDHRLPLSCRAWATG